MIRDTINSLQLVFAYLWRPALYALMRLSTPAERYLMGLVNAFVFSVAVPLIIATFTLTVILFAKKVNVQWIQEGGYTFLLFLGVWSLVAMSLMFLYGAPLGVLIDSLAKGTVWQRIKEGKFITGERYLDIARTVMLYETFSIFFLSQVPIGNFRQLFAFTLAVFFLVFSGFAWQGTSGKWAKPLIRAGMMMYIGLVFVKFFFPSISYLYFVFPNIDSPEKVNSKVITERGTGIVDDIYENLGNPKFYIGLVLIVGIIWGITKLIKKLVNSQAPAAVSGGHHPTTAAGVDDHHTSYLEQAVLASIVVAAIVFVLAQFGAYHERRANQTIAKEEAHAVMVAMREHLPPTGVRAPRYAALPAAANAAPLPEGLEELRDPKLFPLSLTNDVFQRVPKGQYDHFRISPRGYPAEVRFNSPNGPTWNRIPGVPARLPAISGGIHSIWVRQTNGTPTNIVVGMGRLR